jgi:glycosyltransferase involved in cell wall biosynthesis
MSTPHEPYKVNLYSGAFYRHDAISTSLYHKLTIAKGLRSRGVEIDCRIFAQGTDYDIPEATIVPSAGKLLLNQRFRRAHLHIYEFGVYYDLFDTILLRTGRRVVIYHNITPISLVSDKNERLAIAKSHAQYHNLWEADKIICNSDYTRRDLLARGFGPARLSVIHLPPAVSVGRVGENRSFVTTGLEKPVRILFVGRFTPAKGLADLIRAMSILKQQEVGPINLELIGSMRFSDQAFIGSLRSLIEANRVGDIVRVVGEARDDELAEAYQGADIFAMPSYHEGYCVPLIEAMTAGCFPIVYDTSNLPYLLSGLGLLAKPGDIATLAFCLKDVTERLRDARRCGTPLLLRTERGVVTEAEWRAALRQHVASYSYPIYEAAISELLLTEMFPERNDRVPPIRSGL